MKPDYQRSIVNVAASVVAACSGGETGYAPLPELPAERLSGRPLVLLVADGLGSALLDRFPDSHLQRHRITDLNSVFPTTTATAITSFATAVGPQQHAVTGWFTWFRELGSVAAVLPFTPRGGGASYTDLKVQPAQLVGVGPASDRFACASHVLTPAYITDSAYSRFTAGRSQRHGHAGLEDFFDRLEGLVKRSTGYIYAYWTEVDAIAHYRGIGSGSVEEHFHAFDARFGAFLEAIAGSGALVLLTADHGLVDTAPERQVLLEQHPRLARCLTLPLCGEPRAAYCYVRPGYAREFEAYVGGELAEQAELRHSGELIESGWFGLGTPDPRLSERVGDYTLLMRDNWVIRDRLLSEKPFTQVGVHGGTSAAEMTVPLIVAQT